MALEQQMRSRMSVGSTAIRLKPQPISTSGLLLRPSGRYVRLPSVEDLSHLLAEVESLRQRVSALEMAAEPINELDWNAALNGARAYFDAHPGKQVYPDELAESLATSVEQAIDLCNALEKEGAIAAA